MKHGNPSKQNNHVFYQWRCPQRDMPLHNPIYYILSSRCSKVHRHTENVNQVEVLFTSRKAGEASMLWYLGINHVWKMFAWLPWCPLRLDLPTPVSVLQNLLATAGWMRFRNMTSAEPIRFFSSLEFRFSLKDPQSMWSLLECCYGSNPSPPIYILKT